MSQRGNGMRTVYSTDHRLHDGDHELTAEGLVPCFEMPRRAEMIHDRVQVVGLGEVVPPSEHGLEPILRVHDEGFVTFLRTAADRWAEAGRSGDAIPYTWPYRRSPGKVPSGIDGQLGYYSIDVGAPITPTTWQALRSSVDVALTGVDLLLDGDQVAFSLCRPPGHHAGHDYMGGYCFLNNAAVAAEVLADVGRVAVLDIDYHHGNGTQDIFYDRDDVLFASIHGHPDVEYPFFSGFEDETGDGAGKGFTVNHPLPHGSGIEPFTQALEQCLSAIRDFAPARLIVSLGLDTFKDDPISYFTLDSGDYPGIGAAIARLGLPTLYVMEGGYAVEALGINTINVLQGHDRALAEQGR
jgi:acetoin utilization deacetylase AcuC-like enzyme